MRMVALLSWKSSDHPVDGADFEGGVVKLTRIAIVTAFFILGLFQIGISEQIITRIFDTDVQVSASSEVGITLDYSAPSVNFTGIDEYPENYQYPQIAYTAQNRIPGQPLLPVKLVPIAVPFGANPSITIVNQEYSLLEKQVDVAPFVAAKSTAEFSRLLTEKKQALTDWPSQSAYIVSDEVIRGLRIIKVALAPVKYQGGMLYRADNLKVRVEFNAGQNKMPPAERPNGFVFDKIFASTVANFDESRNWRTDWPSPLDRLPLTQSPFDSATVWVKLEISVSGIYKITRYELAGAGVDVNQINPRQMRIFYGGGKELPFNNSDSKPELVEIPISISGADDGSFDFNDQLLFYGEATDRFDYNPSSNQYVYRRNHYTNKNVYWLAAGGNFAGSPKRWATVNGSPQGSPIMVMTSFDDITHDEQDYQFYRSDPSGEYASYFQWYWGLQTNFSVNVQMPDYIQGTQARIAARARTVFDGLKVRNVDAVRDSIYRSIYYSILYFRSSNFIPGYNTITLNSSTDFFFDNLEVYYTRLLKLVDNALTFSSPINPGLIEYHISGTPSDYMLLDISAPESTYQINSAAWSGDTLKVQQYNARRHRLYITNPSRFRTVSRFIPYQPDNLRDPSNSADYIIVTHPLFKDQAQELADFRHRINPELTTRVVSVDDIYNQFSWGLIDPIAIRDFLRYAFENWSGVQPSYVLLLGDGHFDYRNNLGSGRSFYVPAFEAANPPEAGSSGSDENYIYFGNFGYFDSDSSGALDMIIGRICVNSTSELEVILNKIYNYEENPQMGKWRNNIIIAADDNTATVNELYEWYHTTQAETLGERHVPRTMEVQKIYMIDFPYRANALKPDAREALINAFNNGGLVVDWIGHGNKSLWAHEQLFRRSEDIPRLNNGAKLPMVLAASCSIGFFDDPSEQGMAEELIRWPSGGAIATIAATRVVIVGPNADINNKVFDCLLYDDSTTFGGALYIAKYLRQISYGGPIGNDRNFILFGDPALMVGKPILKTEFTYRPDSLRGLAVDSIAGRVVYSNGDLVGDFNGTVQILVKDASIRRRKVLTDRNNIPLDTSFTVSYTLPGATVFSGPAQVTNGLFNAAFFVPKDITYGGSLAEIFVYFDNGIIDGSGVADSLPIAGGVPSEVDSIGPTIEVSYNDRLLSGEIAGVPELAILKIILYDDHGINMTGAMGHGIVVKIDDGNTYQADLTSQFSFDMGSWQRGSVSFQLPELSEGEHAYSVKAWDNYNNSNTFSGTLKLFANDNFALSEVMNYPNPVRKTGHTEFQYRINRPAQSVAIKIFTLAGKKVRNVMFTGSEYLFEGYHRIPYDLRDDDGDPLASGVYIYKIETVGLNPDGKQKKAEASSKLVVLR